jgi:hypothetical protein
LVEVRGVGTSWKARHSTRVAMRWRRSSDGTPPPRQTRGDR